MECLTETRQQMDELERVVYNYLPRICNHCLNPACVAACPSGAIYKRAEDGVVLVNENKCRAWRMCVAACPYKKVYYNWSTGKSEKCILCFPRLETGQAPACAHSCVGRIRYMGVLLYDADRIHARPWSRMGSWWMPCGKLSWIPLTRRWFARPGRTGSAMPSSNPPETRRCSNT